MRFYSKAEWAIAAFLALLAGGMGYQIAGERPLGMPVDVIEYKLVEDRVKVGSALRVHAEVAWSRECPADTERWVRNEATEELSILDTSDTGAFSGVMVGTAPASPQIVRLPLPDRMGPGRYVYRTVVEMACKDQPYILRTPWLPFEIVP